MTDKLDVSIVVPMYNVERCILHLLKDLKKQKVNNAEFLLIDDGSTDNTVKIVRRFMDVNNDKRFKLIMKKNGGVSSARNYGLDMALGKYIVFVDSDDRLKNNFLEKYLEQIKKNKTGIEIFSAMRTDDLGNIRGKIDYSSISNNELMTSKEFIKYICTRKAYGFLFSYIFKKELWKNVKFNEQLLYEEDLLAVCAVILKNPNIKIHANKDAYYYYINNAQSATNTIKSEDLYKNLICIKKSLVKMTENLNENSKTKNYILNMYLDSLVIVIQVSLYNHDNKHYQLAKKEFLSKVFRLKYISVKIIIKRILQSSLLLLDIKKYFLKRYIKARLY